MIQNEKNHLKVLPDVASQVTDAALIGQLEWVGMSGIELPILLKDQENKLYRLPARCDAFVSLDNEQARGIHMSRIFKAVQESLTQSELNFSSISFLLQSFLKNHEGLSRKAKLSLSFEALIQRKALKSENYGWRTYPVKLSGQLEEGKSPTFFIEALITYSSTCPASAALSRQLIQDNFNKSFQDSLVETGEVHEWLGSPQGILATPHAQRSQAKIKIQVDPGSHFDFVELIDLVENVLQTPVQTMVKREDEQEFALRNGQNLMFCEDAGRRVKSALNKESAIVDFAGEFRHVESLHPHDAVSYIAKTGQLHL
jgi:GTP cyclohydrolase I